jgi:hypothetical protein
MNEYAELFGTTIIEESSIDNKSYLENLTEEQVNALNSLYRLMPHDVKKSAGIEDEKKHKEEKNKKQNQDEDSLYYFDTLKYYDWESLKNNLILEHNAQELLPLQNINLNIIKKIYLYNKFEYIHQNMGRGQFNHIGHILNPINEYTSGKTISDVYFQYGIGNTFLMKWLMSLLGGPSIQNYYKTYIFYIFYSAIFFGMLYLLFNNGIFVLGSFALYVFSFLWTGYKGFILAPGIIPSIHFLDVFVIIFLFLYLKNNENNFYLLLSILASFISVFINFNFGLMLTGSLFLSLSFFGIENKVGKNRIIWFFAVTSAVLFSIVAPYLLLKGKPAATTLHYLLGYFSWKPNIAVVCLTIFYLVGSYAFLVFLKNERLSLKYIYILVFFYTQGLFVYYYWSGLSNHLPMVIPFIGLQFFLMLFITREILDNKKIPFKIPLNFSVHIAVIIALILIFIGGVKFYKEKNRFIRIFNTHKLFQWDFDRAHVISTIDPQPIRNAVEMIRDYSRDSKGIYIISKYDNILPFLAERYSLMPHFEMYYYLITPQERSQTIQSLEMNKPKYIFIDTDIEKYRPEHDLSLDDPWHKIYNSEWVKKERASRYGRYKELWKIYDSIAHDYEKVKECILISVYQRKT